MQKLEGLWLFLWNCVDITFPFFGKEDLIDSVFVLKKGLLI